MTKDEIFEMITKNPVFALATSDENVPHVRNMMLYRADENGVVFSTGENKDVHSQLSSNPRVEMCFYDAGGQMQIRIEGSVEPVEDLELKKEIVENYPFLKEWIDREGYDVLIVYCLRGGKATVWTMETNLRPKDYIQL